LHPNPGRTGVARTGSAIRRIEVGKTPIQRAAESTTAVGRNTFTYFLNDCLTA
jgi:hypothetical protein